MRSRVAMVLTVLSLFGLAACGDDAADEVADEATTTTVPTPTEIAVAASDGKLTTSPDKLEAGYVRFNVTNSGKGPAEVLALKLDAGKTEADLTAELKTDKGAPPTWVTISGGVSVPPAKTGSFETILDEGTWALVMPPDEESKRSAGTQAMLTVSPAMAGAVTALPATDANVGGTEYSYDIKGLKAGMNRVTVKNTGGLPHIYVVFGLKPDANLDTALAYDGPPSSNPSLTGFDSNFGYLDAGKSVITDMDLPAGRYGMACFLDNAPGGKTDKPHFQLGMKQEFTVA